MDLITYDFPLRPGLVVRMTLPAALSDADAARMTGFVRALSFRRPGGDVVSDADAGFPVAMLWASAAACA